MTRTVETRVLPRRRGPRSPASVVLGAYGVLLGAACVEREPLAPPAAERCFDCHGDPASGNNAPPPAFWEAAAAGAPTPDAHQSHLRSSDWRADIACEECHAVPTRVRDVGHVDTPLPAEVIWGPLAAADGAAPKLSPADSTCSGVYCHGATLLSGGSNTAPRWTVADGTQAECGTCHGLPPDPPHPLSTDCDMCHAEVVAADDRAFVAPALHVNAVVEVTAPHPKGWMMPGMHGIEVDTNGLAECADCHGADLDGGRSKVSCDECHPRWQTACVFCHGGAGDPTGAPPAGFAGETARADLSVGAHAEHVRETDIHTAFPCAVCHTVPASAMTVGHIDGDGRAEVIYDALNPGGTYDGATGGCANLYCHGNAFSTTGGGTWTDDLAVTCSFCHDDAATLTVGSMSGKHYEHVNTLGFGCWACHEQVVNASTDIIDRTLHVNGSKDIAFPVGGVWDPVAGTCAPACHPPPVLRAWY